MIDTKKLKEIADKSTKVVAWYPHEYGDDRAYGHATVRGPFGRWFACFGGDNGMNDPIKYPTPVAEIADDVKFAAAAMNNLVPLCDEVDKLREQLRMAVEAIKSALIRQCFCDGDPNDSCALCDDLRGALQKIEAMKGGQNGSN